MASETFGEMCERLNGQIDEMRREREQWHQEWLAMQVKQPRQPTLNQEPRRKRTGYARGNCS